MKVEHQLWLYYKEREFEQELDKFWHKMFKQITKNHRVKSKTHKYYKGDNK